MKDKGSRRLYAFPFGLNLKAPLLAHARRIPVSPNYFGARRLTLTPYPMPLVLTEGGKSFLNRAKSKALRKKQRPIPTLSWKWPLKSSSIVLE